jgi:DNA-directed RNA polymerase subunit RPC12/RpoP
MEEMKLRYFCDLCGTEVPKNTVRCPSCGRYFTAIQCPRCGYRGEDRDFAQGCPQCGYMKISRPSGGTEGGPVRRKSRRSEKRRRQGGTAAPAAGGSQLRRQTPPAPSAPVGVYRLIGIVLSLILIVLIVILFVR